MSATELHIDLETYCNLDLKKVGLYRYVEDDSFSILLMAYSFNDDEDVEVIDFVSGDKIPQKVLKALTDPQVIKIAFNAQFERTGLAKYLGVYMPPEQWRCTMIRAMSLGLPGKLEEVGKALKLEEDKQKMREGKALISYFCKPCKPSKANGLRTKNLPSDNPEKWNTFIKYNIQDVVTERFIDNLLAKYPATTQNEKTLWDLDQRINEKGVLVDKPFIDKILTYYEVYKSELLNKATSISDLDNPNSIAQIKQWLSEMEYEVESLNKDSVTNLLANTNDPKVVEFLKIRQELGKTSIKKYKAMEVALCKDSRIRGMLQFYGANRTGRWAGRIVQLQNLPQNKFKDLDLARNLVQDKEFELLSLLYPSTMDVFSQLIRTSFIAQSGHTFIVADYSAIEARVISWLADEKWRQEVFATHGKIYEASASRMFNVPIEQITKANPLRQKGKVAELACGYGGSVGALRNIKGTEDMTDKELGHIVETWREANQHIVKYWWMAEKAAKDAITNPGSKISLGKGITFYMHLDTLFVELPIGRSLAYKKAHVKQNCNRSEIRYEGMNQESHQWEVTSTYGGKIVENITQAIARDCLATAMLALYENGYLPQFHVHDEVVVEVPKSTANKDIENIKEIMALNEKWTKGLVLTADAYMTDYYRKD